MANNEITFEIKEHIGVLSKNPNGYSKEINIVAWNGGVPKVDIREWDSSHERMTRGITLYEAEAKSLATALTNYFGKVCD